MRIAPLTVVAFLCGCAAVAPPAPWFSGQFTARYADARSTSHFSVTCTLNVDCEITIQETTPRKTAPQKISSKNVQRISVDILNNKLQAVRAAVKADPKLYLDENDGPLLRGLRPVIESSGKFSECLGVAPGGGDSIALCIHADDKQQVPVLLFVTMKSACAKGPFCAYYLMPLAPQK
jgi:hypothetical protein